MALRATASLLCAAAFALHPIHVETVAWATERRDLLSTVLVLAAVAPAPHDEPCRHCAFAVARAVALLHALAALSRAQMSLPFVLLALDLWPLGRLGGGPDGARSFRQLLAEKSLSFARRWRLRSRSALGPGELGSAHRSERARPRRPPRAGRLRPRVLPGRAGLSAALAAPLRAARIRSTPWLPAIWFRRSRPGPRSSCAATLIVGETAVPRLSAVAIAFGTYALLVLPVSGLAQSGIQLVAERYAYLSTVPLVLLAGVGTARLLHGSSPRPARLVAALALAVLLAVAAAATRRQTAVWQSDETLWRHVLAHAGSGLADNNLGQLLFARGESGEALLHLVRCLERLPLYSRPWRAIAAILEAPWPAQAPPNLWVAATLEQAAALQPGSTVAAYAAGLAWLRADEPERARGRLRQVLALEPGHEGARLTLAGIESRAAPESALSAPTAPARP